MRFPTEDYGRLYLPDVSMLKPAFCDSLSIILYFPEMHQFSQPDFPSRSHQSPRCLPSVIPAGNYKTLSRIPAFSSSLSFPR